MASSSTFGVDLAAHLDDNKSLTTLKHDVLVELFGDQHGSQNNPIPAMTHEASLDTYLTTGDSDNLQQAMINDIGGQE